MKPFTAALLSAVLSVAAPVACLAGDLHLTVQVGDQARSCLLHLPPAYDGIKALPVVIAIHGAGGTGSGMAGTTHFNPLADQVGFLVAYPEGITGKNRGWTALFGKPIPGGAGAQVDDVDDVGFIRNLIDQLHASYHTDPARVFVCGHSSGAYMAYRVANDLADRVAAAGIVNGSMGIRLLDGVPSIPDIPAPSQPISIIQVRGGRDNLVKFEGGKTERVLAWSAPQCLQHFWQANGCVAEGQQTRDEGQGVTRTLYTGGTAGTEVELVIVDRANHNWPNIPDGLDTAKELWDFFAAHPKVQ
jgi:polyhydroxybutyrate depolymerase